MGDAEWMYENDLDPLYRKDRDTGELVEWEGGLNPAYSDDDELYVRSNREDSLNINLFATFEDAKAWAKKNPEKSIVRSPDGNGFIVNDVDNENTEIECLMDVAFKEIAQAMQQLTNNLQESSTMALIGREFELAECLQSAASIAEKMVCLTSENVEDMAQTMRHLANSLRAASVLAQPLQEPELYEGLRDSAAMAKDLGELFINAAAATEGDGLEQRSSNRTDSNISLISVVKKLDSGDDGVFARIQNDLGTYVEEVGEDEYPLRLMAYGYARRASGAGLVLQGIWGEREYAHIFNMFKGLQDITQERMNIKSGSQQGIEFQNTAAKQAAELLNSYDPRLTFEVIGNMLSEVEKGGIPSL